MGFGEHRVGLGGLLGWIFGFWVFLSFLGLILFLFGVFLTCFVVSVWFRCVLDCRKYKWEWIVGFGEDQVSFGWFCWEIFVVVVISSDAVLVWGVFNLFWGLRCVLVRFLLVIMLRKCKLWVLENIG